jgi:hypothetical protein
MKTLFWTHGLALVLGGLMVLEVMGFEAEIAGKFDAERARKYAEADQAAASLKAKGAELKANVVKSAQEIIKNSPMVKEAEELLKMLDKTPCGCSGGPPYSGLSEGTHGAPNLAPAMILACPSPS